MKMMFGWDAPLGQRILKGKGRFVGITTFALNDDQPSLWWCYTTSRWVTCISMTIGAASTHAPCHSYKAFKRHLKKHLLELQGYDVVLASRYKGHDITARVCK
jgi:hypothetical protein